MERWNCVLFNFILQIAFDMNMLLQKMLQYVYIYTDIFVAIEATNKLSLAIRRPFTLS